MLTILEGKDNKILRSKAKPVTLFDQKLRDTVDVMTQTMISPQEEGVRGIGLAANQVGILEQIIIITFHVNTKKKQKIVSMINPQIISTSKTEIIYEEGCLSLPGVYGNVKRPISVKVKWQNPEGNWCEKKLEKWDARIFLHEYDHLQGILFIDYKK